jgi:hypothetical protein
MRGLFENVEMKMIKKEAARLKIGDRVQIWAESPDACTGIVIETGYNAVKFRWDDHQVGVIHLNDMKEVTSHYGASIVPVAKSA